MVYPAQILDLRSWKLTTAKGSAGKPTEIQPKELATFSDPKWFRVDGKAVVFAAPVNGVTTKNSKNCRWELRELKPDGKTLASWSSTDGVPHTLVQDMAFTRLPTGNVGVGVVGGQVHDADDDVCVWRCEATGLWLAVGDHRADWLLIDPNYRVGTRITTALSVDKGEISAWYQGRKVHAFDKKISGAYFRAGAYTQANAGAKPNDSSNYGECRYWSVRVVHGPVPDLTGTGQPTPESQPEPTPVGPIAIIRHGEKPSGDSHELSAKGWDRARALPPLWTTPRADLFQPTWVFASKGQTDSMRMLQTALPTAEALGLLPDTSLDSETAIDATAKLLVAKAKAGLKVLAVLEHSAIPAVGKAMSKFLDTDKPPSDWDDDDYSSGWMWVNGRFVTFQESVLPGDRGYEAPAPDPVPVPDPVPPVETPDEPVPPPVPDPDPVPPAEPTEPPQPAPDPVPDNRPTMPDWIRAFLEWVKATFKP